MNGFFSELKRRKVLQACGLYLVGAWLVLQVASIVLPALFYPDWSLTLVLYLLIIGFPLFIIFAWFFDLSMDGLKQDVEDRKRGLRGIKPGAALLLALLVMIGSGTFFYQKLARDANVPLVDDAIDEPSVAVLPFANLSGNPDQQYLAEGIADELINTLARIQNLKVAARSSSFLVDYPDEGDIPHIAQRLGVSHVLEGSVQRTEDFISISVNLIDARDGFIRWSDNFERQIADVYTIQDEIIAIITSSLELELTGNSGSPKVSRASSIDAYNLYLQGRYFFEKRTVRDLEQAQRYFENAIARDPGFAPAYSGLVDTLLFLSDGAYGAMPLSGQLSAAVPLINRALELDPQLAEVHASLGFLRMFETDYLASEAALKRAIELSPNLSRALVWLYITYERMLRPRDAFDTLYRAYSLDPLAEVINANMAAELWIRGRNEEALQAAGRIIQANPESPLGYRRSGRLTWTSGNLGEAVTWYRQSMELAPDDRNSHIELGSLYLDLQLPEEAEPLLQGLAHLVHLASGMPDEAVAAAERQYRNNPSLISAVALAKTEARAGNYERSLALLEPFADGADQGEGMLFQRSGIYFWDPQIAALELSLARLRTGDAAGGNRLLDEVREHYAFLESEGFDHPLIDYQKARLMALRGEADQALLLLRRAVDNGWRSWKTRDEPAFAMIRSLPAFDQLLDDMDTEVTRQRDLLGL